ncbi:hypothetical protein PVAP13_9NG821100 [Panicum virgatum]|uniref:Uncharacterized protein n=1 Tax=Panicum virgatum TaxID=38727 RepID=A0A8T0N0T0_PANVG|nr:hypothetical protein PVAP13_9NG821100 [Panicum virgatum]
MITGESRIHPLPGFSPYPFLVWEVTEIPPPLPTFFLPPRVLWSSLVLGPAILFPATVSEAADAATGPGSLTHSFPSPFPQPGWLLASPHRRALPPLPPRIILY